MRDGKRLKRYVKEKSVQAGRSTGRFVSKSARYVGGIAKRRLKEKVEDVFGEPIDERERQIYNKAYRQARAHYARSRATTHARYSQPQYQPVSLLGGPTAPRGKKKQQQFRSKLRSRPPRWRRLFFRPFFSSP